MRSKLLFLCIAVLVVFTMAGEQIATVANADDNLSLCYTHILSVRSSLTISGDGVATCTGKVTPYNIDSYIALTVTLLQKDGDNWRVVEAWTDSGSGNVVFSLSRNYQVDAGTYKVAVSGTVQNSNEDSESFLVYSGERTK